jgi:hypothetical protein
MSEFEVLSDETGFPIRSLPGTTKWLRYLSWAAILAGVAISKWMHSSVPFSIVLGIGVTVYLLTALSVSCPHCKRSLISRMQTEGRGRERAYYDCPDCKVTWKSEITHEDD